MKKVFPKLYEKSSTDKIKHWEISVEDMNHRAMVTTRFGLGNSKVKMTTKFINVGKNIGKSNETTPYEQALLEIESTWKKKLDKGYVEKFEDLNKEVLLPMLAHNFNKRKHNINYPAYVQAKLDGVRCLAEKIDENTMVYHSRMGKKFTTLEHLTPDLLKLLKVGQILDGEIYSHEQYTFQEVISFIKKLKPESKDLEYHVYDLVDTTKTFDERNEELENIMSSIITDKIRYVISNYVESEDKVKHHHQRFMNAGYEGTIIRNTTGMYKLKQRSADLQKYKEFHDAEYVITGGTPGTGTEEGCVVFTVITDKKQEFSVRPKGTFDQRIEWMKNIDSLIGDKLTVRYQELTDDGIPRFPVGISIRDYEN